MHRKKKEIILKFKIPHICVYAMRAHTHIQTECVYSCDIHICGKFQQLDNNSTGSLF
jgi:hypothetical protein